MGLPACLQGPGDLRVPEKAIARFSSRRTQISKTTLALAEQYETDRGHAPDQRALASMRQFANARTRRGKEPGALDFAALPGESERTSRDAEVGTLSGGELPYPVAMSIGIVGNELRCTGLVLGLTEERRSRETLEIDFALPPEEFQAQLAAFKVRQDEAGEEPAAAPGVTAVNGASLRHIAIPDLIEAVARAAQLLSAGRTVPAELMDQYVGPGWEQDRKEWLKASDDAGQTFRLPPLIGIAGPRQDRHFLDQLYPGMVPDLPLAAAPRVRGKQLGPEHYVAVADGYRRACRLADEGKIRAPMRELCRWLGIALATPSSKAQPIPEPTVRRWVARAREMGLLGPSRQGAAGEYSPDTDV